MNGLIKALQSYMAAGREIMLVTVFDRAGSAPRGAGAHMIVGMEGRLYGTIGGGAVEYEAEQEAMRALQEKKCCCAHYYLKENDVQELGMVCGGEVDVAFSYLNPENASTRERLDFWEELERAQETAWMVLRLTELSEEAVAYYGKKHGGCGMEIPKEVEEQMIHAYGIVETDGRKYYYERLTNPGRVYIFGGGHVAQALVPVLAAIDFRCVVLEDRDEFCKRELFPKAERVMKIDMQHISEAITITDEDYVCVMTRGHKDDTIVQEQILRTQARYIGVIGSRRKKATVFRLLKQAGLTDEDLARVTTPIGLEIQAETPAEIAISIAAQMIQVRAGKKE